MKKFFLLSGTGRMTRGVYFLNMLWAGVINALAWIENTPYWLILVLTLISAWWAIYAISARVHDLWYPGWLAWIRLWLQILPIFWELADAFATLACLCIWLILLFTKWWECDNQYWPNPYTQESENFDNREEKVGIEEKVEIKEDIKSKKKTISKTKTSKTAKTKKEK